jgi:hypothetical protein
MRSKIGFGLGFVLVLATIGMPAVALCASTWVERSIVLPRHDWAFDFGLGIGHQDAPDPQTGVGMNVEGAVAVTRGLELGLRTGFRFGDDGRFTRADEYGRLYDRETFGTNNDDVANPEFRIRGALVSGRVFELGLEGRATLPFERGSEFGMMFGLPLRLHIEHTVRLDAGVYVPIVFYDPTLFEVSLPLHVWIQATHRLWLGPMTGARFFHRGAYERTDIAMGFGLGYAVMHALDFKTMIFMPGINHEAGARNFGVGVGLQVRID